MSAKNLEIRQIEPCAVRLAEAVPAESVRLKRKSTMKFLLQVLSFRTCTT